MTILPCGTHNAANADYEGASAPRTKDITVFSAIYTGRPEYVSFIRELAALFPDRKIWLQIKNNYKKSARGPAFIEACTHERPNVHLTDDNIFTILKRSRYVFSDPSTILAEALEFQNIAFFADILKMHESCIYRDFEGLCVSSASQAATKLQEIEAGNIAYNRDDFSQLVDLSGMKFFETLRDQVACTLSDEQQ